ncbi:hemoglobin cathodic subunit beta-like [Protopterus annectens]|uniref:hemoglobin cathodic subunit beta-like n=1 Tax=Protopterus annectens TaxID=7888 RepID=UPI001CFB14D3|nr:hemoglobin cathodic subunit beta-like [Protopterus annectens]
MVHWDASERKAITSVWAKVDCEADGLQALLRLLVVYPWTQRYFSKFGDLSTAEAIMSNPNVKAHGLKVFSALDEAIKHMDNIKGHLKELSLLHSETLNVDPANFTLLGNCVLIVLAAKLGAEEFNSETHATWEKLMAVVSAGLSKQYY